MKDFKEISRKSFNEDAEKINHIHSEEKYVMKKDNYNIVQEEEVKKKNFENFLDVGCGIGNSIKLLLQEFPKSHYVGIDIAEKMIEIAKKKNLPENLPFDENRKFDVVICKETFHHFPNPEIFFKEIYRVLKPNGRFIIFDFSTTEVSRWIKNTFTNNISSHSIIHHYNVSEVTDLYKKFNFEILRAENVLEERMIICGKKVLKQ